MTFFDWAGASWGVLLLFLIPIGGGIPGGVLLARNRGLGWPSMLFLYLLSDVILAFAFEPILGLLIRAGNRSGGASRAARALLESMRRAYSGWGPGAGHLALILIAFGVDPMTGRAASAAAGHGFVSGWTLSITGDMLYFILIAASTLSLNSILGDGTWTTLLMLAAMVLLPGLLRRRRRRRGPEQAETDGAASLR